MTEVALLGVLAQRFGGRIEWDAENMRITKCPELNAYVKEPVRKGWEYGEDLWNALLTDGGVMGGFWSLPIYRPIQPPSTNMMLPCMYAAASLHRKTTGPAKSSASPQRPAGMRAKID